MTSKLVRFSAEIPLLAVLMYVALVPLASFAFNADPHDVGRWCQLLLLPFTSIGLAMNCRTSLRLSKAQLLAFTLLGVLAVASVLAAARPGVAAREFILMLSLISCAWAIKPEPQDQRLAVGVILGAALYATLVWGILIAGLLRDGLIDYWYISFGYANPRFLNHVQSLSLPLLIGFAAQRGQRVHWRALACYSLAFNAFMVILLQGRGTMVALLVAGVAAPALFGRSGRRFTTRLLAAVLMGAVLYALVTKLLPMLLGIAPPQAFRYIGDGGSVERRFFLWQTAWADVIAHPWLGVGPMHFAHSFNGEAAHPHNIYFQIAAEYGLPFFCLISAFVAFALIRAAKRIRTALPEDALAIASFLSCVAALVDGLFSGNFVMPMAQIWIVIAVAVLGSRLAPTATASPAPIGASSRVVRVGALLLFCAQLYLIDLSWPEWREATPRISQGQIYMNDHVSPRFWVDGWF